jgi:hypothetical protein
LAASFRAWKLRHASENVNRSWLYAAKEVRNRCSFTPHSVR